MIIAASAAIFFMLKSSAAFKGTTPRRLTSFLVNKSAGGAVKFSELHMSAVEHDTKINRLSSTSDFASAMPNIYEELGFKEDQIAMGLNPQDVLSFLGTREDIIAKFLADNDNKFNRTMAEQEVDKFLMDYEMVSKSIAYKKWANENPELAVQIATRQEEGFFSPRVIGFYALWIGAGVGLSYFSKLVGSLWQKSHPNIDAADAVAFLHGNLDLYTS